MSSLEHFTIPQLKKLVKHFDLKNIKISLGKQKLIEQLDKHIHFDGYQFHLKDSNENNLVKPDILKKEPRQHIKTKKGDINYKQMSNINQSIQNIIDMLVPSKGKKSKPVIDEFGNFEPIEPKPKKIKIKVKKNAEEDTDLFPILNLKTLEKPKAKPPKKEKKVNPKSKPLIDDPTKDFNTEKELLDYLDYLQIENYSAYQRTVNKLIDYHKKGVKLHLNVYNQLI
jgi:hypothetical protein